MFLSSSHCTPLPCELKKLIYNHSTKISCDTNSTTVDYGDMVNSIFYIDKGRVRVLTTTSEGKERVLGILEEGYLCSNAPFILGVRSDLAVVTETPVILYLIDYKTLGSNNLFKDYLITQLSETVISLVKTMERYSIDCCKTRLLDFLLDLVDTDTIVDGNWYNLKYQYSQEHLGKIIGANRVTIARLIHELRDEQLIRIEKRNIQVRSSVSKKMKL